MIHEDVNQLPAEARIMSANSSRVIRVAWWSRANSEASVHAVLACALALGVCVCVDAMPCGISTDKMCG